MIFLGGTTANNNWRDEFIVKLLKAGVRDNEIFNPVVKDWSEEDRIREDFARKTASVLIVYIGNPNQIGNPLSAYSMVEATTALYDRPHDSVVIVFDTTGMEGHPVKSMKQSEKILRARFPNAIILNYLDEAVEVVIKMNKRG